MLVFRVREVFGGPRGLRKVREASRLNFLQISSKSDLMVPTYDQQTKKVNDRKVRTIWNYFNVSGEAWRTKTNEKLEDHRKHRRNSTTNLLSTNKSWANHDWGVSANNKGFDRVLFGFHLFYSCVSFVCVCYLCQYFGGKNYFDVPNQARSFCNIRYLPYRYIFQSLRRLDKLGVERPSHLALNRTSYASSPSTPYRPFF